MTLDSRPWQNAALVVGATLLILTACTPEAPTPSASPTSASPAPTPDPTIAPASAPEPRLDLTCDDLAASLPLSTTFPSAVSTRSRAQTEYGAHPSWPEEYKVRSVGGLVCEFSNGEPQSRVRGSNPAYVGARILVLPDPGSQWDAFVATYGVSGTRLVSCFPDSGATSCSFDALGADRWVDVSIAGAVSETAGVALGDAVLAAVTSAGPGAATWTPPAGTLAVPDACTDYISNTALQTATGFAAPFILGSRSTGGGGFSLHAGAEEINGSPSCLWAFESSDSGVGTLKVLRGGEWAWAEAQTIVGSTPITVAGLAADDEAWLRCGPSDAWCVVDLVLGGNWIELYLWEDDPGVPLDRRAAVQNIAIVVVANVTP
ncbi:MAG: hypothetical protein RJQ01_04485 [Microcella sp.]|uniref:hypothetical protein n=1 Tax=Microcella sp. TaxID=1913979 RepID=UPI0033147361